MPTHKLQFDSESSSSDDEDAPPPPKKPCPDCEARRLAGEAPQATVAPATAPPCDADLLDGTASVLAAPSPDTKTAKYLRSLMESMRPDLEREIAQAEAAFASGVVAHNAAGEALRGVSDLINSNADYIPYSAFSDMLHRENQLATMGGVANGAHLTRSSNKELATFNHIDANLERMLERVVRETENFALSPAQRIVVAWWLENMPMELCARVCALEPGRLTTHVALPPNTRPALTILNLPTGSGKTVLGILMAMTEVCDPTLWQGLTASWRERVWRATSIGETGLASCVSSDDKVLARVVVAYVPSQLITQWKRAAELVNEALRREKGYGFTIWTGLDPLQRGSEFQKRIDKTLTLAHKRSNATGVPILWIVAHTRDAVTQTLRQSPSITFATKIYDECSHPDEPTRPAPEARAVSTVILQATIARLGGDKSSIVSKLALGAERFNQLNKRHAAIFHMLALPDWLAHLVSKDMTRVMPRGIQRVSLKVRVQSLSGQLLNSDLTITGVDDLLKAAIKSTGEHTLSKEEYEHLLAQCTEILASNSTRADDAAADAVGPASSSTAAPGGASIHTRLLAAKANAEAEAAALPQPAPRPPRNAPEEEQQEWWEGQHERSRVQHKRLVFGATTRLFGALAKAIDPSNRAECPIGLDEIPPEHCGILWCCSHLFDIRNRKYFKDKCPVCNQRFASCVMVATQAIAAIDPDAAGIAAPAPALTLPGIQGDEPALRAAFAALSATDRVFAGSMKAVVSTIDAFLRFKPLSARILLAFPCEGDRAEQLSTRQTRETLRTSLFGRVHSVESIGASASKTRKIVDEFVGDAPTNQVILINTNDRDHSRSLEGLDLWSTDLIVLATKEDAQLKPSTFVQAIGRMMRPQFKTYVRDGWGSTGDDDDDDAPSGGCADKWMVLLEEAAPAAAAAVGAPEDSSEDEGAWEDIDVAELVDVAPEEARVLLGRD